MAECTQVCGTAVKGFFDSTEDVDRRLRDRIATNLFDTSTGWKTPIHAPVMRPFLQDLLQPLCVDSKEHEQFLTFFESSLLFYGWKFQEAAEDLFAITMDVGTHTLYTTHDRALRVLLSVVFNPDWHRTVRTANHIPRVLYRCFLRHARCFSEYFQRCVFRNAEHPVHCLQFKVGDDFDFQYYDSMNRAINEIKWREILKARRVLASTSTIQRRSPMSRTQSCVSPPQFYHPIQIVHSSPEEPVFDVEGFQKRLARSRGSSVQSSPSTPVESVDFFDTPGSPLLCAPTPTIPKIPIQHDVALLWTAFVFCRQRMDGHIQRLLATSLDNEYYTQDVALADMRVLFPFFYNMIYNRTEPRDFEFANFFHHHMAVMRDLAEGAAVFEQFLKDPVKDSANYSLYQYFSNANTVMARQDDAADARGWHVLAVEETLHDCQELVRRLTAAYVFFEAQALRELLTAHHRMDFVGLRMPRGVSRKRLSVSMRRILDTFPEMPEDRYLLVSTRTACYLVIEVGCLQQMRLCMLGYAFNTYERVPKTMPVYPLLIRAYFMESAYSPALTDTGLWAVMNTVLHWVTKQKQAQARVMAPEDPMFGVYRILHRILARWESVGVLAQDLRRSFDAPEDWGLLRALSSFIQFRQPHFIRGRTVQWLYQIFFISSRTDMLQRTYPRVLEIVKRLHQDTTRHDERVALNERQTGTNMAHLELYVLCLSRAFTDEEARDLFQSIFIDEEVQLRGSVRGISQVLRFEKELHNYMGNFAHPHSERESAYYKSVSYTVPDAVLTGQEPVSLFSMFLRMMEWCSLHSADEDHQDSRRGCGQQFRGALEDMQGPCELDPADLLEAPGTHKLPVSYDAQLKQVVYLEDSFFLLTMPSQNNVLIRDDDALGDILTQYFNMDQERAICGGKPFFTRVEYELRQKARQTARLERERASREGAKKAAEDWQDQVMLEKHSRNYGSFSASDSTRDMVLQLQKRRRQS